MPNNPTSLDEKTQVIQPGSNPGGSSVKPNPSKNEETMVIPSAQPTISPKVQPGPEQNQASKAPVPPNQPSKAASPPYPNIPQNSSPKPLLGAYPSSNNNNSIPEKKVSPADIKNPFSAMMQGSEEKTQKKRILAGVIAGGSLISGGLLLTSFINKKKNETAPVILATDHKVSDLPLDDLNKDQAKEVAKADLGGHGFYKHRGEIHSTIEDEWAHMSEDEKEKFLKGVHVEPNNKSGTVVDDHGNQASVIYPLATEIGSMSIMKDVVTGEIYLLDSGGNHVPLENVSIDEDNNLIRTDPETGEITHYNPTMILEDVAEGKIDVSIYPSDVEVVDNHNPIDHATWVTQEAGTGEGASGEYTEYVSGWDTDGDGSLDNVQTISHTYDDGTIIPCDADGVEIPELAYNPNSDIDVDIPPIVDENPNSLQIETYKDSHDKEHQQSAETSSTADQGQQLTEREILNERLKVAAAAAGIEDVSKIKIHETEDGYDAKVKGDDGEKMKLHFSHQDLQNTADSHHDTSIDTPSGSEGENGGTSQENNGSNPTNDQPAHANDVPSSDPGGPDVYYTGTSSEEYWQHDVLNNYDNAGHDVYSNDSDLQNNSNYDS